MFIKLRYIFSSLLLIPIYSFCEEISWDVGLTSDRELISAKGILKKIDAPTILYLAGLMGPSQSAPSINTLFEDY